MIRCKVPDSVRDQSNSEGRFYTRSINVLKITSDWYQEIVIKKGDSELDRSVVIFIPEVVQDTTKPTRRLWTAPSKHILLQLDRRIEYTLVNTLLWSCQYFDGADLLERDTFVAVDVKEGIYCIDLADVPGLNHVLKVQFQFFMAKTFWLKINLLWDFYEVILGPDILHPAFQLLYWKESTWCNSSN